MSAASDVAGWAVRRTMRGNPWVEPNIAVEHGVHSANGAHQTRVHADDTTVTVLDPGRGTTKTGRLWCYVHDDRRSAAAAGAVSLQPGPQR